MSKSLMLLGASALSLISAVNAASYIEYSTVTGYFLQDDAATDASTFDYTATNFGLINRTYDSDATFDPSGTKSQWERFENQVEVLNSGSGSEVQYKVLYIGRHGEGYHNAAETYYGTPAWNCYWSELDGNGTSIWADAKVTPNGAAQAQIANQFWASQITNHKQSLPENYYTSPLTRCLQTANITFYGLADAVPTIKEFFREGISMHTCDRRSSKTYIQQNFPGYKFEAGFSEDDELWRGIEAETSAAQDIRSKTVLDDVFSSDGKTFLSITTHSGETSSILRVVGHRTFRLSTGAVIPVLVKAETIEGSAASSSITSWVAEATCTVPPITSLATGGCVCPSTTSSTSPATITASITSTSSQSSPTGFNTTTVLYPNSTAIQISTSNISSYPETTPISLPASTGLNTTFVYPNSTSTATWITSTVSVDDENQCS